MPTSSSSVPAVSAVPPRSRGARVWGETWRLAAALAISVVVAGSVLYESELAELEIAPELQALDLLVGLLGFGLVLLRRRAPMTVALLLCAATSVSMFVVGPVNLAVVSLATRRRWWHIVVVGVVFVAGGWTYGRIHPALESSPLFEIGGGVVIYALLVWIGAYIGLRREHLRGLHEQIATAEREQASRVAQARANERARIAREMHDVLAHRMSLVAMHAGALAYRTDLPREQVAETAALVRDSAHEALGELREVLGVLRGLDGVEGRDGGDAAGAPAVRPERPQPTLGDLAELVSTARAAGAEVRVVDRVTDMDRLPTAVSRTAFRVVQESLTNARKHAPGMPASVVLRGAPGQGLRITVGNPTVGPVGDPGVTEHDGVTGPPSSGLGLLGLAERVELAGGTLEVRDADGRFVVRAWLPWAP